MIGKHATRDEIERYVTGELTGARAAAFEAHVEACPSCAEALAGEARFETALHEIAGADRMAAPPPRRRVRAELVVAAAAMAAGLALWLARPHVLAPNAPSVVCGAYDDAEARQCRATARCAGLLVEDAPEVPHYEILPRECADAQEQSP
jgi:anti-sigma factor RsiW